jgi:Polysaccharide deacetylase/DnaB-helicase binding domain of primase
MIINTTHGIVENAAAALFTHRNLLDSKAFEHHLRTVEQPYHPLRSALMGEGPALTIDDSTVAAAEAAVMARRLGHAVTIFVNGFQIAERLPYFFSRLNVALDATRSAALEYDGASWDLSDGISKARFRRAIKKKLAVIGDETRRDVFVTEIAAMLGVTTDFVPRHLCIITENELKALVSLGVDVQNHGWTHSRVGSLSPEAHTEDIRKGREWIRAICGIEADLYAVPNGDGLPPESAFEHCRAWFLLDNSRPCGEVSPGVYGRLTLSL